MSEAKRKPREWVQVNPDGSIYEPPPPPPPPPPLTRDQIMARAKEQQEWYASRREEHARREQRERNKEAERVYREKLWDGKLYPYWEEINKALSPPPPLNLDPPEYFPNASERMRTIKEILEP